MMRRSVPFSSVVSISMCAVGLLVSQPAWAATPPATRAGSPAAASARGHGLPLARNAPDDGGRAGELAGGNATPLVPAPVYGFDKPVEPAPAVPAGEAGAALQGGGAGEVLEYYAYDALGSVRMVFDVGGNVAGQATYGPFGAEMPGASGMPSQRFTGMERDAEVGLDNFEARSYQVRTGRFSTVDPGQGNASNPQSWNRYAYAANNPLMYVDPDGKTFWQSPAYEMAMRQLIDYIEKNHRGGITSDIEVRGTPGSASFQSLPIPGSGRPTNSRGGRGRGGKAPTTHAPLPPDKEQDLQNTVDSLQNQPPDQKCIDNVISKLPSEFKYDDWKAHLANGVTFYDGTKSAAPIEAIYNPWAAKAWRGDTKHQYNTVQEFFKSGLVNAWASVVSTNAVIFVRPSRISGKNGGVNPSNRGLIFHETLHTYSRGTLHDEKLKASLRIHDSLPSSAISDKIAANCK